MVCLFWKNSDLSEDCPNIDWTLRLCPHKNNYLFHDISINVFPWVNSLMPMMQSSKYWRSTKKLTIILLDVFHYWSFSCLLKSSHNMLPLCGLTTALVYGAQLVWFGLLGFNASATARVISRRWNDDNEISFLVEETGVPGGNHRPMVECISKSFSLVPMIKRLL